MNYNDFFSIVTDNCRGNSLKLFKERFSTNLGKFSFVNRIRPIDEWNLLCEEIVSVGTVDAFKNKLDHYLRHCRGFI